MPEIADGLVEITMVAREPGYRSKIAVVSHADGVDPVGACVGPRGSRVRMVVSELRGEKIDIIPYNDEPARFVAKALSPARVREVLVDDEHKQATVIVPGRPAVAGHRPRGPERPPRRAPDRLADRHPLRNRLRDRRGRGARRARRISAGAARRSTATGVAARTRRLPGSRYCGLPAHQALEPRKATRSLPDAPSPCGRASAAGRLDAAGGAGALRYRGRPGHARPVRHAPRTGRMAASHPRMP